MGNGIDESAHEPLGEPPHKPRRGIFDLKGHGTTWQREVIGGLTTFFAMAYIMAINPVILSSTGMDAGAVFIATCLSAFIGTMVMGLLGNVPYALAPGMGLNAFFTYTVVKALGFTWQEALTMVFICGLINILITVTKIRKKLIKAIPHSLQCAISGGIGAFIIFIGLVDVGLVSFGGGVPALSAIGTPALGVFVFGLVLAIVLSVLHVKGGMIIAIIVTTLMGLIPFSGPGTAVTAPTSSIGFVEAFRAFPQAFGVIFTAEGFGSLFSDVSLLPEVLITIFAFSMSDTFDTIGTFIGTGRKSGIFSDADMKALDTSKGFSTRMDRALFADSIATSIGAVLGTSNTTTYVESAAGISEGARTGLASVVTACCFAASLFLVVPVTAIPFSATAPVLIIVGCMMLSSFRDIKWDDIKEAIPAMFAGIFMAFSYSISYGMAYAFISYVIIQAVCFVFDSLHFRMLLSGKDPLGKPSRREAVLQTDGSVSYVNSKGQVVTARRGKWEVSGILVFCALLFLVYFILLPVLDYLNS